MLKYKNILITAVISVLVFVMMTIAQDAPVERSGIGMRSVFAGGRGAAPNGRGMRGIFGSQGSGITSPEITEDKKVTFRISAPNATSVSVSGDWGGQSGAFGAGGVSVDMTKNDQGLWSVTVGPLESEFYGYTFNIDGAQIWDPANMQLKRDGTRIESVLIVPGKKGDLYSVKDVPHGTIAKVWYDSPTLKLKRRMYVYTPPGYETSGEKYPVLYLLHGAGGDEDAWTSLGCTQQIMDNLIAAGKAKPMIVVMTNGNADQTAAPNVVPAPATGGIGIFGARSSTRSGGGIGGGPFPESLAKDVVPFIEKSYRVLTDKANRAIAGLSMGGAHTISVSTSYPAMFDYIGVMSMGSDNAEQFDTLRKEDPKLFWVGCGTDDFLYQNALNLVKILKDKDFNYKYNESTGGHTWTNWRIYLSELAPLLFK